MSSSRVLGVFRPRTDGPAILRGVSESASKLRPPGAPKLTYIYTSGIWIHGDNRKDVVSDTTPITKPIDLVTWRIPFEQAVIGDPNLNGFVVRPALVYGRTASILAGLFRSASEGKVAWYGTPGGRYCLVHADDLADLYVRAIEKAQVLGGQIFDAANDFTESVDDLMQRLTEISGAQSPYEYIPPSTREQNLFLITRGLVGLIRDKYSKRPLAQQCCAGHISLELFSVGRLENRAWQMGWRYTTQPGPHRGRPKDL
ncbi:NAD(P)-binding protein [Salix suchowensis]|nr:NAD(P)-binding protein [Salix suchowensis]